MNNNLIKTNIENLIKKTEKKRKIDLVVKYIFLAIALICTSVIFFIVIFILVKGITPFVKIYTETGDDGQIVSFNEKLSSFFTLLIYNSSDHQYGVFYLVINTLYATFLSMLISIPVSLLTSLIITRIAIKPLAKVLETGIELLAGIPSVIYGLFGMGYVTKVIASFGNSINYATFGGRSLLAGSIILAIMSIPTMTMMNNTALKSVDPNLFNASLALGASKTQTNFKIVIKAALSGIFAGIILGVGRAIGEATAVQMVIGGAIGGITSNPLDASSTLTSQMLMGMGEAVVGSLNYDIRFSSGILLIILILLLDISLNTVKNKVYQAQTGRVQPSLFTKIKDLITKKSFVKFSRSK